MTDTPTYEIIDTARRCALYTGHTVYEWEVVARQWWAAGLILPKLVEWVKANPGINPYQAKEIISHVKPPVITEDSASG